MSKKLMFECTCVKCLFLKLDVWWQTNKQSNRIQKEESKARESWKLDDVDCEMWFKYTHDQE